MVGASPGRSVLSLAQGVVNWPPPPAALAAAAELTALAAEGTNALSAAGRMAAVYGGGGVHSYGPSTGLPALVDALRSKLAARNGLVGVRAASTARAMHHAQH